MTVARLLYQLSRGLSSQRLHGTVLSSASSSFLVFVACMNLTSFRSPAGLVFYLTGTPQDDDVVADGGREMDTLSRASSFFDADAAGNVSFLYEPEEFGLLDDDISTDSEMRRPKTLTMRQVPSLVLDILGQTTRLS